MAVDAPGNQLNFNVAKAAPCDPGLTTVSMMQQGNTRSASTDAIAKRGGRSSRRTRKTQLRESLRRFTFSPRHCPQRVLRLAHVSTAEQIVQTNCSVADAVVDSDLQCGWPGKTSFPADYCCLTLVSANSLARSHAMTVTTGTNHAISMTNIGASQLLVCGNVAGSAANADG